MSYRAAREFIRSLNESTKDQAKRCHRIAASHRQTKREIRVLISRIRKLEMQLAKAALVMK